jgi:hypothetical protein
VPFLEIGVTNRSAAKVVAAIQEQAEQAAAVRSIFGWLIYWTS